MRWETAFKRQKCPMYGADFWLAGHCKEGTEFFG